LVAPVGLLGLLIPRGFGVNFISHWLFTSAITSNVRYILFETAYGYEDSVNQLHRSEKLCKTEKQLHRSEKL
jgi:hypothetical protein